MYLRRRLLLLVRKNIWYEALFNAYFLRKVTLSDAESYATHVTRRSVAKKAKSSIYLNSVGYDQSVLMHDGIIEFIRKNWHKDVRSISIIFYLLSELFSCVKNLMAHSLWNRIDGLKKPCFKCEGIIDAGFILSCIGIFAAILVAFYFVATVVHHKILGIDASMYYSFDDFLTKPVVWVFTSAASLLFGVLSVWWMRKIKWKREKKQFKVGALRIFADFYVYMFVLYICVAAVYAWLGIYWFSASMLIMSVFSFVSFYIFLCIMKFTASNIACSYMCIMAMAYGISMVSSAMVDAENILFNIEDGVLSDAISRNGDTSYDGIVVSVSGNYVFMKNKISGVNIIPYDKIAKIEIGERRASRDLFAKRVRLKSSGLWDDLYRVRKDFGLWIENLLNMVRVPPTA